MSEEGMSLARRTAIITQKPPTKPPPKPLLPPAAISPAIRVARWTALIAGLGYGFYRNRRLEKKEQRLKEYEDKHRPAREAAAAREKAIRNREEMLQLAAQLNMPIPADFDQQYKIPDSTVTIVQTKKH
ncbi:uncharacterized protein LOC129591980 [Paramacrobiotus metropolitanus]|uniref:uncharacterized protein LOC129591980 n=1 Tax=Paramacrobiotus metropolitanus TaxID=2943436 RepID=UPI00244659F8|nr:uncharacterized protein LOC129591980 [Paramacrobiotus metropolitanus]